MKKLSVKSWLSNIISESEGKISERPKLSPDNVDFVSKIQIIPNRNVVNINFVTKDEKSMELKTKSDLFYDWVKSSEEEDVPVGFVKFFLEKNQPTEKLMSEIVDEYNGLIGDKDLPVDHSRMVGLSSKDSTQAAYQTRAKYKNNFNTGAISGFITW